MKFKNPFKSLSKFEMGLWLSSVIVIAVSSVVGGQSGLLATVASLLGVTALIFIAKGMLAGQFFIIVFAILYGIVSLEAKYYGEMITYVGMSLPMAVVSTVSWIRHPHKDSDRVEVAFMTAKKTLAIILATAVVTVLFFFILRALGNASLYISTLSIATSFIAASLTFFRSPYYALAYAVNDVVLIALWVIASIKDISNLSMVFCFVMFLLNDIYGFYNWKKMQKEQEE
ncbi:MAG: nicotinamide mononucleotide transporter [Clostridia bacterium]|nr:nicotinamide mononucleotide transporter [Clostridia bacterium]